MTTAEKIEIIVTTVAGYYGIEWQEMWRIKPNVRSPARRNMVKLMAEYLGLDLLQVEDHVMFRRNSIRSFLKHPDDLDYSRISHEIRMQLSTSKRA